MKSVSGFWAGIYTYGDDGLPQVKFDCELVQKGTYITGQITEVDTLKPSRSFILEAVIDGQIHKRNLSFTKTYTTPSDIYNQPVEYIGRVSLAGNHIEGTWSIGPFKGAFSLKRDKGSKLQIISQQAANDLVEA